MELNYSDTAAVGKLLAEYEEQEKRLSAIDGLPITPKSALSEFLGWLLTVKRAKITY